MIEELTYSRSLGNTGETIPLKRFRATFTPDLNPSLISALRKHPDYRSDVDGMSPYRYSEQAVGVYISEVTTDSGKFGPRVVAFVSAKDELEAFMHITRYIKEEILPYA